MNNKNYLFLIISIFLGFLISFFYNQRFDKNFFLSFLLISILFYIIFYFLGENKSKENFKNNRFFNTRFYNNLEDDYFDKIMNEEEYIEEEHIEEKKQEQEQEQEQEKEQEQIKDIKYITTYEENPLEEEGIISKKMLRNKIDEKPDISKYSMETPIPNSDGLSMGYGPLNINISYNSQNSINELDNIKEKDIIKKNDTNKNNQHYVEQETRDKNTNNLCNPSRVYNNSDWIYGTNAWTNDPDYYIPTQGCNSKYDTNCPVQSTHIPLNELATKRKYGDNNSVAPLMINQPWSEFKSGDDLDSLK